MTWALSIDSARGVVHRDFLVVELRLAPVGIGMHLLFALQLERTVGDNHVLLGAIGAVVVRGAPVVRGVPLALVERGSVEVVLEHELPPAEVGRRVSKRERSKKRNVF